jgi:hypothetical protein
LLQVVASGPVFSGEQNGAAASCLHGRVTVAQQPVDRKTEMSVKGEIKQGAGFIKEEMNEHGKSPESQRKAQDGRDLRNEGRLEDGKTPKTTKPGTRHPEK